MKPILIITSNGALRRRLADGLAQVQPDTGLALADVTQASELFSTAELSAVFVDVELGEAAIREQLLGPRRAWPVILCGRVDQLASIRRLLAAGADDAIIAPFGGSDLEGKLSQVSCAKGPPIAQLR